MNAQGPSPQRPLGRLKRAFVQFCLEPRPPLWRSVLVGLVCSGLMVLLRLALQPLFGTSYSFVTFFIAVAMAAATSGFAAGAVALAASAAAALAMFMPTDGAWRLANTRDVAALVVFSITASIEGGMAATLRLALIRLRASDENLRLLTDELNHRVKNSLATVLSIARQTARHSPDLAAFDAAFQRRVQAMAKAHEVLTRRRWRDTAVSDILAAELGMWGPRIVFEGEEMMMKARAALSLSMIVHELATNAAKYGALSGAGRVEVRWRREPEKDKGVLEWRETGGPTVVEPDRKGFGSVLIGRLSETDLGGEARVEYRPEGLVARFEFPLAGAAV